MMLTVQQAQAGLTYACLAILTAILMLSVHDAWREAGKSRRAATYRAFAILLAFLIEIAFIMLALLTLAALVYHR